MKYIFSTYLIESERYNDLMWNDPNKSQRNNI